ncbi:MAG: formylmethanofuran dehydrogenase subunit A [Parvibaculaceae bacterium]
MIRLAGGRVIDPVNGRDGTGDLWIENGRIVPAPPGGPKPKQTYDLKGRIVMAGGIDIHSHIAGGNVNTARLLLPEHRRGHLARPDSTPLSNAGWSTSETGRLYAAMGFTTVVEPAMSPSHALHAHMELADIPIIDKAALCILGNDDYLLSLLRAKASPDAVRDYVAWMVSTTRALGVKVINAGAAAAFKSNVRTFALDDVVPDYGVSSRQIVLALQRAVEELGIPHPLHVHCNNLGAPGSADTAAATMQAADGQRIHFAHLQFYGYGVEGDRKFSSAAARLAEEVNARKNVTVDVGQVMFCDTVTVSSDVLRQFSARAQARPRKWVMWDGEGNGGGIVPYQYRARSFYNAVQWAVGLELFLLINDPWRVFFTTDHPNGAPFTAYPQIFALLMDRHVRAEWIARLPKAAMAMTTLASIAREYTLPEIAIMTRAAPARLLGLKDRGHLGPGAVADVAVYTDDPDKARMFGSADYVFKGGELVVRGGEVVKERWGKALTVDTPRAAQTARRMRKYYDDTYGLSTDLFAVPEHAVGREEPFGTVPCAG